jgi:hypothetical protein
MASTFRSKAVKGAAIEASVRLKLKPTFAFLLSFYLFQCPTVVSTVSYHCHSFSELLETLNHLYLQIRSHTRKYHYLTKKRLKTRLFRYQTEKLAWNCISIFRLVLMYYFVYYILIILHPFRFIYKIYWFFRWETKLI